MKNYHANKWSWNDTNKGQLRYECGSQWHANNTISLFSAVFYVMQTFWFWFELENQQRNLLVQQYMLDYNKSLTRGNTLSPLICDNSGFFVHEQKMINHTFLFHLTTIQHDIWHWFWPQNDMQFQASLVYTMFMQLC